MRLIFQSKAQGESSYLDRIICKQYITNVINCIYLKLLVLKEETMANSLIQLRVDENLRLEAVEIFDKLGIDLSTAIRMFLVRSVLERGIPFPMKLEDDSITRNAIFAMKESKSSGKGNMGFLK